MMKKLCALMLALLLVVPALAMAEKVPYETLKVNEIATWDNITISPREDILVFTYNNNEGVTDKFKYHFSGVMRDYQRDLGGGKYVTYAPNGEVSEATVDSSQLPAYDPVTENKNNTIAPVDLLTVLKKNGINSLEAFYQGAVSADSIQINNKEITVDDSASVDWIAAGSDGECKVLTAADGIYSCTSVPSYVLAKKGSLISVFRNEGNKAVLEKVYLGSLSYYVKGGYTHMKNDTEYTDARYNVAGECEYYFLYSSDLQVKTAYDHKNRLKSHETWTSDKAYWCYEDGAWWTSADGDPEETELAKEVPESVLKSLLRTDVVAEYDVGEPLTDASQLVEGNKGLPFIVSTDAGIKNATVKVESQIVNATTSTFDITPTSGGDAVQPTTGTKLYLPLPAGMDAEIAKEHDITVTHKGEVFSTIDGTATVTEQGLLVNATSYSPYTVIWGDEATQTYNTNAGKGAQNLPSTGDESNMLLSLAMLAISGAVLFGLRKRTA